MQKKNGYRKHVKLFLSTSPGCTHHGDVEGIEEVKGQGGHQVNKEPAGSVVEADGAGLVHHLTRLAHVGGAEVQDDVCQGVRQGQRFKGTKQQDVLGDRIKQALYTVCIINCIGYAILYNAMSVRQDSPVVRAFQPQRRV